MAKATKADVIKAKAALLQILKPGDTLYGVTRSHSASGSSVITPIVFKDGPLWPTWAVAAVTGYTMVQTKSGNWGIRMGGYGYNKLDALADATAYAIFGPTGKLRSQLL